jgi:carotenoid 1,2-hydratase
MIHVTHATDSAPTALLREPGAFAWWYVDVVDDEGNGAVLIWSWGLPFLPGYTDAARRQTAQRAEQRPSLNVAFYRQGRPAFYLLREIEPGDAAWSGPVAAGEVERWTFGQSVIERVVEGDSVTLGATLDLDMTGGVRLTGRFDLTGARSRIEPAPTPHASPHLWGPVAPHAAGRATIEVDGDALAVEGLAYHDRNWSPRPLDQLGIERWTWARVPMGDESLLLYLLEPHGAAPPTAIVRRLHADGRVLGGHDAQVSVESHRRDLFGVSMPSRLTVRDGDDELTLAVTSVVDRGPFYLRALVEARRDRRLLGAGWAECVVPDRIDLPRHRPLVRMAVDAGPGRSSFWLPLFSGLRQTRLRRLLRMKPRVSRIEATA